jgi:type I restriction enzyme S subunit
MISGWAKTTIAEAADFTSKPRGLDVKSIDKVPFVRMEAVPQGYTYIQEWTSKPGKSIRSGNYFEKGDCLLAKITPCFENGKQGIAQDIPATFGYASTELIPFRGRTGVSNKFFLFYFFLDATTRKQIAQKMEGATGRQRIPISVLKDWPIPLPPLPEQKKIAAVLLKIQRAIETQEKIIQSLRDLKKSTMQHLFSRGLRGEKTKMTDIGEIPESWDVVRMEELGEIVTGTTPPTNRREYYEGGGYQFIAPADLGNGIRIRNSEKEITEEGISVSRVLPSNTICFVCIGSSIGKVGITVAERAATNQQINAIVTNDKFDPFFVAYLLLHRSTYLAGHASPSPVPIMSKGKFSEIPIPITRDKDIQEEIGKALLAIENKEECHDSQKHALQDLFKTTLNKLMTGDIRVADLDIDVKEVEV